MRLPWKRKPEPERFWELIATTDDGDQVEDPSEDALFMLLEDVSERPDGHVIVEREPEVYIQALVDEHGTWHVEYRDGSADRHYGATTTEMRVAHAAFTGWAFGIDGWKDALTWERLEL